MFCGSLLAIFNAYKNPLYFRKKISAHGDGSKVLWPSRFFNIPWYVTGTLLIFTGLGIAIPQYYAYAREFILYDQLEADTRILRASLLLSVKVGSS